MTASRRAVLGGVALAAPLTAPAQHHHPSPAPSGAGPDSFARAMQAEMQAMAQAMDAAPMTGNPDADFLAMMIPHHEGAIAMANLVLVHGRDPLTRQLAEAIIASQRTEIASMEARLRVLTGGGPLKDDRFPALSGTRGQ